MEIAQKGKSLEKIHYVLSGHELVEFENIHDWELFRYIIYRYKYNKFPEKKLVVRIHPAEDRSIWIKNVSKLKNVYLSYDKYLLK